MPQLYKSPCIVRGLRRGLRGSSGPRLVVAEWPEVAIIS